VAVQESRVGRVRTCPILEKKGDFQCKGRGIGCGVTRRRRRTAASKKTRCGTERKRGSETALKGEDHPSKVDLGLSGEKYDQIPSSSNGKGHLSTQEDGGMSRKGRVGVGWKRSYGISRSKERKMVALL